MSETASIPAHVGIILDGNRRWAKANSLPTLEGHREGAEVFKQISTHAFDKGVKYLTGYVFSTENWSRTEEEVGYLMKLVIKAFEDYLDEFHKRGIRIVVLGRREGLRAKVLESIQKTEASTANNKAGTLALCFNYSGQGEIVDAVQSLVDQNDEITESTIRKALYGPEIPDLDLIIRSSGEQRLSNFMLWRAAYSELYFTDKYWPDFKTTDFDQALYSYNNRKRRFGA